ncbi:MAG TPA: DUF4348 domain-containing protein [Fibrobacteraceae bacterium]|nr:DUF4348 domain-containing protein [Fibrobacteraceae bacterium]
MKRVGSVYYKRISLLVLCIFSQWTFAAGNGEVFDDFLVEFMENAEFQKSRVQFPLLSVTMQMETEQSDTAHIEKAQWRFNDFKALRSGTQVRQFDNFERKIRDTDERVVSLIGNDNGVLYSYFFKRIQGRWYLVRVLDESS